jgi:hypothetical protein
MTADLTGEPVAIHLVNPSTGCRFDFRGRWLRNSPATDRDVREGRARFRGDKVYLPLPPGVAAQLAKGVLEYATLEDQAAARRATTVAAAFGAGPGPNGMPMPEWRAPHPEWAKYAVAAGIDEDAAAAMSRDQIRAHFGQMELSRDDEPVVDMLDEDAGAQVARRRR